jgi:F-type H+-transporting ATPase subunit delta
MKKGTKRLAVKLLSQIYYSQTLRLISETLDDLSLNKHFKDHAHAIVTDGSLTDSQKKTQLSFLIRSIDVPQLHTFFTHCIDHQELWLFQSGKTGSFDRFVRTFQQLTQEVDIVYLTTAVPLTDAFIKSTAKDLSRSFNRPVVINHQVDRSLIGGVKVKVDNFIFDYSLKYKFRQFQRIWLKTLSSTNTSVGRHSL